MNKKEFSKVITECNEKLDTMKGSDDESSLTKKYIETWKNMKYINPITMRKLMNNIYTKNTFKMDKNGNDKKGT